jgi:YggT family protein
LFRAEHSLRGATKGSIQAQQVVCRLNRRAGAFMAALLDVVLLVLHLYTYVIIAAAILSWLVAFNVVNARNDLVRSIWATLTALTEPVFRPVRRMLPNLGGIDVSPIIVLLIIFLIQDIIARYVAPYVN